MIKIDLKKWENYSVTALRLSIALVFVWFGGLKIAGYNPVFEIVHSTFPIFATETGNIILGVIEVIIGLGLVIDFLPIVVHVALILHLCGTLITFVSAPDLMFDPGFPILSLEGEFVMKNVILAVSGFVVLLHESQRGRIPIRLRSSRF